MLSHKNSDQLVRDIALKQIEEFFPNKKYHFLIETLSSGKAFDTLVEVGKMGVRDLVRRDTTPRGVEAYMRELTKIYIVRYLEQLEPKLKD